ncbi:peptide chain release factor N(5)-glutamine methyltransferase [Pseudooceanicola sp.]|uniref:peptide chain release factor N(5)-glutamine methyltransferase n=1 Tax=Pseudooceanicola sp. TaxID=1914328 RepID=UPI0026182D57|nr:peptide chain release factor N(5)-glutamine methyltransferase [Pseudooceanicola sp.]MDF1854157.1 peptide chain release factor N(5)-glutamine methyltransferase [Pseudooceanicola sp.]
MSDPAPLPRFLTRLAAAGVPDPGGDLRRLFDWAYAAGQAEGTAQDRDAPNAATLARLEAAVAARVARQPVSQIIGRRAFWRHDFLVTGDVLDPRPETEALVELALAEPFQRLLDLGTGSGAIAISLLAERPGATGTACDLSGAALDVARRNAAAIGVADRLALRQSDWFAEISGEFDLILSNPPYIAADEMPDLAPEVRDWEPHMALTPGGDGLAAYRQIASGAAAHLRQGGRVLVEIGPTQAAAVIAIFRAEGFDQVTSHPDLDRRDRVVAARLGGNARKPPQFPEY